MANIIVSYGLVIGLALVPMSARAHCDAADGPVARAAIKALNTQNVNLILPFAPVEAESELSAAFQRALSVREKGPEAKALADSYFMETAVRLHRVGEGASFTGLKPAGTDFGPAIPAAEKALKIGKPNDLTALISEQVAHGIEERYRDAVVHSEAKMEPRTIADVSKARKRVQAELAFVGYVEGIYLATRGGVHVEAAIAPDHHQGTK
ncbi:DUF6448 family protein [Rhizobium aegyptiacum]|uniref:DUF6448 family protein n=1 Tax=Rhizobium aegyptiacum TaxID=1764550 RepID=UPI0007E53648|nr:DUF6448 family protein [Rhizobium aegyptiacum]